MFVIGVALLKVEDPIALPSYIAIGVLAVVGVCIARCFTKGCSRRIDARALRHGKRRMAGSADRG